MIQIIQHLNLKNFLLFFLLNLIVNINHAQNTPCGAITLPSNMTSPQTFNSSGLSNSGIDNPICGGNVSSDIWFQVTVPPTGFINISTFAGSMTNAGMAVYEGPCNNPTETACINDNNCQNTQMPGVHFYTYPPGTTLYIRMWPETGGTGTFDILVEDSQAVGPSINLSTTGTATTISNECVQLTSNSNSQSGCAWDPSAFDFTQPIDYEIIMNFGTIDGNGADGICLIFQNDPSGLSTCGTLGGGLGASGIQNSFIVEFDTWNNGAGVTDIPNDHCSIFTNGNINNATPPIDGPVDLGNIEDGADHNVRFTWNPATNGYEVYFDGALILSGNFDIIGNCFGGQTSVFGGFSASTGGATNIQTVCIPPVDNFATPTGEIKVEEICEGDGIFAGGGFQTTSGIYSDIFISNGCDSIVYTDLTVHPTTFSTESGTMCSGDCFFFNGLQFCSPGQHTVTLTNAAGCDSIVTLNLSEVSPIASILPTDPITCTVGTVILDGSLSSSGNEISYLWTGPSPGCIVGSNTQPTIAVACSGSYTLTVFYDDGTIACNQSTSINVVDNIDIPIVQIAPPTDISCAQSCTDLITGGSSSGNNFIYDWSGPNGFTSNAEQPMVCEPGFYFLTITNTINGCSQNGMIEVGTDDSTPVADAGPDVNIDCNNSSVTLSNNSPGSSGDFTVTWTDINGNFISNDNDINVNTEGEYILIIESNTNDCVSQDTVNVSSDFTAPSVGIIGDNLLNCTITSITLQGTTTATNANFAWTDQSGTPLGTTTTIDVSTPGEYTLEITNTDNGCTATNSILISQDITAPVADAGEDQILDCVSNMVNLSANNSSGNGMLSFQWLDADGNDIGNQADITVLNTGTYQVVVTDINNGCSNTDEVVVSSDATFPTANAGMDTLINCNHPTITLSGSLSDTGDNFTYVWTNSSGQTIGNDITVDVNLVDTYSLLVTNTDNGCSSSDNIVVTEDFLPPAADAGNDIILDCLSGSATLDASSSSVGSNISYEWQDGSGNPIDNQIMTTINAADTYTIVVTDDNNGCTDTDEVIVSLDTNAPVADAGPDLTLTCSVSSVNLDGSSSSSGANITYEWSDENNTLISQTTAANVTTPGTYSLQVTNNDNGCFSISNAVVSIDTIAPTANLSNITIDCANPNVLIGEILATDNPNWSFSWEDSANAIVGSTDTITVNVSGDYTLQITDTNNDCSQDFPTTVLEDTTLPTVNAGNDNLLDCNTTSITLDGSGSSTGNEFNYEWTDIDGNIIATTETTPVTTPGTYTLTINNSINSCVETDEVVITIDTIAPVIGANNGGILTCDVLTVDLIAQVNGNVNLSWEDEVGDEIGTTANTPISQPGTYNLVVIDADNGCSSTTSTTVTQDIVPPPANAGNDFTLTCTSPAVTLIANEGIDNSIFTFEWEDNSDGTISNNAIIAIDSPDLYELIVTNTVNGCTSNDIILISQDADIPFAELIPESTIDCTTSSFDLVTTNTSTGSSIIYELWLNDNMISATNTWEAVDAGTYTLVVTDSDNGCVDSTTTIINIDQELPIIGLQATDILTCTTLTALLDASDSELNDDFNYEWSSEDGNLITTDISNPLIANVSEPGTYELMITNTINNCVSNLTVDITQDIITPPAIAGDDVLLDCNQPTATLTANATVDNSIFTFEWIDEDGNTVGNAQELAINGGNDYELVVTNTVNGCTSSDNVTVSEDFEYPIADMIADDILTCTTTSLSLAGSNMSTGSMFSYQWLLGGNVVGATSNYTTTQEGLYGLIVTNTANGCKDTTVTNITIDQNYPDITAFTDDILTCDVLTATIDGTASAIGTNLNYQWNSISGGTISPDASNPLVATVQTPGTYELVITNLDNDCVSDIEIDVPQDIVSPFADAGQTFELNCHSPLYNLSALNSSASGPISYAWSTGSGQFESATDIPNPTISQPGVYSLVVTNTTNGCTDNDDVVITSNFITGMAIESHQPICYDDLGVLFVTQVEGGLPPYIYSIDGGENFFQQNVFPELEAGEYNVVIQDANACETSETAAITAPAEPLVSIEPDVTILQGESYQLNAQTNILPGAIDTILWTPADSLSCLNCLDPVVSPMVTTTYHVTVIDTNACQASNYLTLYVDQRPLIYVPNAFSPNGDGTNDVIMIFSNHPNVQEVKSFQIYDRWGQQVFYAGDFFPNDELYGWNGINQNSQPHNSAVFVWWAEIKLIDGRIVTYKGDVTLIR